MIGFEGIRTGEGAKRETYRCGYCGKWVADRYQAYLDWTAEADERWFDVDNHRCLSDARKAEIDDERYRAYLIAKHGIQVTRVRLDSLCDLETIWGEVMCNLLAARYLARTVPPAYVALIGAYIAPAGRAAMATTVRRRQLAPVSPTIPAADTTGAGASAVAAAVAGRARQGQAAPRRARAPTRTTSVGRRWTTLDASRQRLQEDSSMNPSGILLMIAGTWVVAQVLGGNALARLGVPGFRPEDGYDPERPAQVGGGLIGSAVDAATGALRNALLPPYKAAGPSMPPPSGGGGRGGRSALPQ